jgi:hypothetical protein
LLTVSASPCLEIRLASHIPSSSCPTIASLTQCLSWLQLDLSTRYPSPNLSLLISAIVPAQYSPPPCPLHSHQKESNPFEFICYDEITYNQVLICIRAQELSVTKEVIAPVQLPSPRPPPLLALMSRAPVLVRVMREWSSLPYRPKYSAVTGAVT